MSEFRKNILKLFSSAVLAQLTPWAISPLLARIYTPKEFGILTIFLSLMTIGNTIITGKYEVAIYLPKSNESARYVVKLNMLVSFIITAIALIVFLLFGDEIKPLLNAEDLGVYLYIVPLVVLCLGIYKIFYSWLNRLKKYNSLAASKIVRSGTLSISQLGFGLSTIKTNGLILGQIIGELTAALFMVIVSLGEFRFRKEENDRGEIIAAAKKYSGFPKYSLPGGFINSVSNQAPVFMFAGAFGTSLIGQYGMTQRVLTAPLTLLAKAILDVFKQKASEDFANTGSCREIFLKTLKRLTILSLPIFLIIGFFAPQMFTFFFGDEWYESGRIAQVMAILFFMRFVASPLSYVLYIAQKQKVDLAWQIGLSITLITSIGVGIIADDFYLGLWLFTISYSLMYVLYLYLSYKYTVDTDWYKKQ